jgi:hypothetical protein
VELFEGERFYLHEAQVGRFGNLHELVKTVDSSDVSDKGNPTAKWSRAFDRLLKSGELDLLICETLTRMSDSSDFQPTWISLFAEGWFIAESPKFTLNVLLARPAKASKIETITSLKQDCLVGNLGTTPVRIERYAFPEFLNLSVFDGNARLVEGPVETLNHLQSVSFACNKDVPYYEISAPTLLVQLSAKQYAPLAWVFEKSTKKALLSAASSDAPVRDQTVAELLQHLALEEDGPIEGSLDILTRLAGDPHHYVRWRALQSLCAIDFERARPYLIQACDDPHSTLAEAARKVVRNISLT